ncbi:DUF3570 domain-containing protein [Sandaracinus amylolyticus]|uniref:DUF3570 domain-containing protein n=1 Tax=Sandaracinus amylolyticus TaxID=927083 RepID=UPI001F3E3A1F|nr:DUF3570 domain-containing protein [Sandaracinus amylolyticus]UJR80691.1 DUF3570 domain-containing protein [Sandaracinus amylolyticus]
MLRAIAIACALLLLASSLASAQSGEIGVAGTLYHEGGGPLNMTVVTPGVSASVDPIEELTIRAGWEADIVSGASVAVVDAPAPEVDVISTATQLFDFRNVISGGAEVRSDYGAIRAGYAYGFENDYRSHAMTLGARAEAFERTAAFDISYARGWDEVCDVFQPRNQEPVDRRRLASSEGCFGDSPELTERPVELQTFQGSWTQAWAPIFTTQLTVTAQLVDGFQSNPYRAVWLGRTAAQEHHPDFRARYAAALGARLWLQPLSAALQANVRGYRDTWDVTSITAELAYEQVIEGALRIRVRGRYYNQTGAAFYSDDYALAPRGQFFTGDRELSPMWSTLVGAQIAYTISSGADGAALGFLRSFDLLLKGDWLHHDFPSFHYGRVAVPNVDGLIVTLALEAAF